MSTRRLAIQTLEKIGCHPDAYSVLDAEASDAVVLLAVTYARFYQDTIIHSEPWGGWPDYFMAPEHRIDLAPFISQHWRLYRRFRPAYEVKLIEWDKAKLRAWLRYARERIRRIERRLVIW